ncbi:YheC/YheD family protein [Bacillus alveayuensis]|jgi:hypothetical protein|uniref:YheC/YheD family endospore coat-associated protein n=1 Tax=Aeribacillus alveayuensis TaxID=279215 RepID=UPI0005D10F65|nr:YheC/YheD family protein [Bacillus alveayuensis]
MIYEIHIIQKLQNSVILPKQFHSNAIQTIQYGSSKEKCLCFFHEKETTTIYLSQDLAIKMHIQNGFKVKAFIHQQQLILGPLVGIFTAGFVKSLLRPIGNRSIFFSKLIESGKSLGAIVFVFGSHQINWENKTITGYTFNEQGWLKALFPFPNVIYNRLPNRKIENLHLIQHIKNRFIKENHIPLFNPGFFNKWDVFEILSKDKKTKDYLPESIYSPNKKEIMTLLNKHQSVFLKPANGSLGLGVYKLIYLKDENALYCRYIDDKNKKRLIKYPSLETFFNYTFKHRSLEHYIAQQGIKLIQCNGNPIDFRVHVNKNQSGKWIVTAMAAKVAGKGSITTHIKNGGIIRTISEIDKDLNKSTQLKKMIKKTVLTISEVLDAKMNGSIGEIGFDLGMDRSGKIWIFEANSKPGRSIFDHHALQKEDRLTREYIFEYAEYLMKKALFFLKELHYEKV